MKTKFYKIFLVMLTGLVGFSLLVLGLFIYVSLDLPDVKSLANYSPAIPSEILTKDGHSLLNVGKEKRELVKIENIPKVVIDAFLSAEDSNFFEHKGVDYMGIVRALLADIRAGKIVQGGSTITQQVAKMLLLSRERSFVRKLKDLFLAQEIEKHFKKEEILFLYLNHIYLGGGYYGVKMATFGYFNKEMKNVTVAEAALMAGLLVAPGKYSPYNNTEYAKSRQKYVLGRMLANEKITRGQYEAAIKEKLKITLRRGQELSGGHFTDWIRQRVIKEVGEENFLTGGFKIVTTLDWELQQLGEEEVLKGVEEIDKRRGYKGPITRLKEMTDILNFEKSERKKIFESSSAFFELMPNGEKKFEIGFENDEFMKIKSQDRADAENELLISHHVLPSDDKDRLIKYIDSKQTYKAVVLMINDAQKTIFASIGGASVVIPYDNFKWAHERIKDEKSKYFPLVTKPSQILKNGDVIQVKILESQVSLWSKLENDYKKSIQSNDLLVSNIKQSKYLVGALEQDPDVEGALVALKAKTGEVLAMIGGANFSKSQFNRALQSLRQPGSSFKPVLYAASLEEGHTPASIIMDSPEALGGIDQDLSWKPRNYDGKFYGPLTFRRSLELSRNVPTIKLASELGVKKVVKFLKRIGMHAKLENDLSFSLGSFGITLLNLVSTYAIFPNGGYKITPKLIQSVEDRFGKKYAIKEFDNTDEGNEAEENPPEVDPEKNQANKKGREGIISSYTANLSGNYVFDARLSYIMTNLLKGVVQNGTGQSAREIGNFIGGKTGTTNNYVDAWFVGFSSNVVTGVWTGLDNNQTLGWAETGSKSALPIWKKFMRKVLAKYGDNDFPMPKGIINVLIDKKTGKLGSGDGDKTMTEAFVAGTEPKSEIAESEEEEDTSQPKDGNAILDDDDFYLEQ
jgi:penicillin-binding protein 1A